MQLFQMGLNFLIFVKLRVIINPKVFKFITGKHMINGYEHCVSDSNGGFVTAFAYNQALVLSMEEAGFILYRRRCTLSQRFFLMLVAFSGF